MRISDFVAKGSGLLGSLALAGLVHGCSADGDGDTTPAADTGSADDDGDDDGDDGPTTTSGVTGTDGDAEDTSADDSGGESSDGGPIDPTEGELPPVFTCPEPDANGQYPESAIYVGNMIISSSHQSAVDISELEGIAIVTRDLIIDKTNYVNLDFLQCIVEVQGHVTIFSNYFLEDLSGLDNLVKVGRLPAPNPTPTAPNNVDDGLGTVTISSNPMLVNLNGLNALAQIGEQDPNNPSKISSQSLIIRNNDVLQEITGFDNLALIYASLVIQENPLLEHIDGLKSLQGVGGAFSVTRNASLCMSSVNCVGGGLTFLGDMEHSTTTQNNPGC